MPVRPSPIGGTIDNQPLNDWFVYLENLSIGTISELRYGDNTISAKKLKISTDADKIKLINLSDEVRQAMAGTTPVNATPSPQSVVSESIAPDAVDITHIKYKGSLNINRGIEYPLKNIARDGVTSFITSAIKNAFLDIKVYGARLGKYYRIEWIGSGTTALGENAKYQIFVSEYEAANYATNSATGVREAIKLNDIAAPSIETGEIITRVLQSNRIPGLTIVITYRPGELPAGSFTALNNAGSSNYSIIIDPACYIYAPVKADLTKDDVFNQPNSLVKLGSDGFLPSGLVDAQKVKVVNQYANKTGDRIRIAWKYNSANDMWIDFNKCGANSLMQIYEFYLATNTGKLPSKDLTRTATLFKQSATDWVGPYQVKANANGNAEVQTFTGGWHGYNGTTGSATARTVSYKVFADGVEVKDGDTVGAERVDIEVVNHIQGWNTKLSAGGGREILKETIHYTIQNGSVEVITEIQALESLTIALYYGLQTSNSPWNGTIHYLHGDSVVRKNANAVSSNAGLKSSYPNVERYCLRSSDNTHNLIAWIDRSFGLGTMFNVADTQPCAFTADYGKSYFNLINNVSGKVLATGEKLYWRGGYVFTPGETFNGDLAYYFKEGNELKLVADFLASSVESIVPVQSNKVNSKITVESKDNTVTVENRVLPNGIKLSSNGYGTVKLVF